MLLARLALDAGGHGCGRHQHLPPPGLNAYEVPPTRARRPQRAQSRTFMLGCQQYCASTPGCLVRGNERTTRPSGTHRGIRRLLHAWCGVPSNHIISGCLPGVVKGCGERPPAPAPAPPAPAPTPTPWTPVWTATQPSATNGTYGYPLLAADKAVHTYVCESLRSLSMHFLC